MGTQGPLGPKIRPHTNNGLRHFALTTNVNVIFQHSPSNRSHLQMDVFAIIFKLGWSLSLGEQVSHILLTRDILQGHNLVGDLMAGVVVLDIDRFGTLVLGVLLSYGQAGGVILVDQSGSLVL